MICECIGCHIPLTILMEDKIRLSYVNIEVASMKERAANDFPSLFPSLSLVSKWAVISLLSLLLGRT